MTLGSGDYEDYIYDKLDRLVSVMYNGSVTYTLTYDANGFVAKCADSKSGITHEYEYDGLGRLIRAWQKDTQTGERTLGVENIYDSYGRADKSSYVIGDKTLSYNLYYKADSNLVSSISMPTTSPKSIISYTYDNLDRLTKKNVSFSTSHNLYEEYSYKTYTFDGTVYTTPLISSLTFKKDNTTTATYSYTYDSLGNITTVSKDGTKIAEYEYDSLGQLVREDDCVNNISYVYEIDKAGNITGKYSFPWVGAPSWHNMACYPDSGTKLSTYTYSTSAWGDLLTNYNGKEITYDEIGNPTKWHNASSLAWNGRKLTRYSDIDYNFTDFTYNADGIRTRKSTFDTVTSFQKTNTYTLDGTKIIKEVVFNELGNTTDTLYYYYDESGSVAGFQYNDLPYYYQKNIQGDILRIVNITGNIAAQYTYVL